jgi:hypothetical protein
MMTCQPGHWLSFSNVLMALVVPYSLRSDRNDEVRDRSAMGAFAQTARALLASPGSDTYLSSTTLTLFFLLKWFAYPPMTLHRHIPPMNLHSPSARTTPTCINSQPVFLTPLISPPPPSLRRTTNRRLPELPHFSFIRSSDGYSSPIFWLPSRG